MNRNGMSIFFVGLATAMLTIALPAQERSYEYDDREGIDWSEYEWEPGQGLHREEWYDPSDWFDWDEGIEYEDYGTYAYDDWGYRDLGYDDYRYGYGEYGYDYGDYSPGYDIYSEYDYGEDRPDYDFETYGDYDLYDRDNFYTDDWYETEDTFSDWYEE